MRHTNSAKSIVRDLRKTGLSLGQIHKQTKIPKTTIRSWIKDIPLSENQIKALKEKTQKALQEGRIINQAKQKEIRLKIIDKQLKRGINEIGTLSKKELLVAGIALYWAEGFKNKHEHRLGFCNSDPEMIKFYIKWLRESFGFNIKDLIVRLTLNESYMGKTDEQEKFWSEITSIPREQFSKTFYQKTKWKKQFNTDNYHGVLRIHVNGSLDKLLLMKGWIQGLKGQLV